VKMKPSMANPKRDLKLLVEIVLDRSGLSIYERLLQENLKHVAIGLTLTDVQEKTEIFPERPDWFYGEYFASTGPERLSSKLRASRCSTCWNQCVFLANRPTWSSFRVLWRRRRTRRKISS